MEPLHTAGLLTDLLRQVSRSFYLTVRILPGQIRPQIGLAYLLARTTDTIADTDLVPLPERLAALASLRQAILSEGSAPIQFPRLAAEQADPAEKTLLERVNDSLALLQATSAPDRQRIREVLEVIVSGQELDLRRFADGSAQRIIPLRSLDELDDYTWRVAGVVGEFWTRMCAAHLFRPGEINEPRLLADGKRFGQGLQLVNILRDLPRDLRQGRCYLPEPLLQAAGLKPSDLLDPSRMEQLRPGFVELLQRAREHLSAGWSYTRQIPRHQRRLRLACAWPILIGQATLQRLQSANILDAGQRVKVPRREVRQLLLRSILLLPFAEAWENQQGIPPYCSPR